MKRSLPTATRAAREQATGGPPVESLTPRAAACRPRLDSVEFLSVAVEQKKRRFPLKALGQPARVAVSVYSKLVPQGPPYAPSWTFPCLFSLLREPKCFPHPSWAHLGERHTRREPIRFRGQPLRVDVSFVLFRSQSLSPRPNQS